MSQCHEVYIIALMRNEIGRRKSPPRRVELALQVARDALNEIEDEVGTSTRAWHLAHKAIAEMGRLAEDTYSKEAEFEMMIDALIKIAEEIDRACRCPRKGCGGFLVHDFENGCWVLDRCLKCSATWMNDPPVLAALRRLISSVLTCLLRWRRR